VNSHEANVRARSSKEPRFPVPLDRRFVTVLASRGPVASASWCTQETVRAYYTSTHGRIRADLRKKYTAVMLRRQGHCLMLGSH